MLDNILPFLFLNFSPILIYSTGFFPCHFVSFRANAKMSLLSDIHKIVAKGSGNKFY